MDQPINKSESLRPYIVCIKDSSGDVKGTGFLLEGGFLLTAYHVIDGVEPTFQVWDKDENRFTRKIEASRVHHSEELDLAIFTLAASVQLEERFLHLVHERKTMQGRKVAAYGFPHDEGYRFNGASIDDPFDSNHPSGLPAITLNHPGQIGSG